MKKLIALFITLIYTSVNACLAYSELYYLRNAQASAIAPVARSVLEYYDYQVKKTNPIYGVSAYDNNDDVVIILQQSGQNVFYFYDSDSSKKVNKKILKEIKNLGIDYEAYESSGTMSVYQNLASRTRTSGTENYVFTENINTYNTNQQAQYTSNSTALRGYVAQIAKGTVIPVYLQNAINTASTNKGDKVVGVVTDDVKYNGVTVFPQGSMVYGFLTTARHASYGARNGRVVIEFNQIVTPDNKSYAISAEEIDFKVTNEGKVARYAGDAVVGAIVGGLLGLVVGAMTGDIGTMAAIGAGVGAGGSVIANTAEKGVDAEIPSFTEMELTLTKPVNVTVNY